MHKASVIQAVFFDLGGTLFHHLPPDYTQSNLLEVLSRCGAPHSDEHVFHRYRQHRNQVEREHQFLAFFLHRGMVAQALQRTMADLELSCPAAATAFCDAQRASVTEHLQLRADTLPTLTYLHDRGIYRAIVSNIDDDYIVPLMERTGLAEHVDAWISSERARSCKPHPSIYQQAIDAAGVSPQQILFVGDSFTNDVVGAARMGMQTAFITADHEPPHPRGADFYIGSLRELTEVVR